MDINNNKSEYQLYKVWYTISNYFNVVILLAKNENDVKEYYKDSFDKLEKVEKGEPSRIIISYKNKYYRSLFLPLSDSQKEIYNIQI